MGDSPSSASFSTDASIEDVDGDVDEPDVTNAVDDPGEAGDNSGRRINRLFGRILRPF